MATKNNTTKVESNENNNEVMNQTIVRLNEMKSVKMASLSKSKRPAAKFNKEVATYLLENWDNVDALKTCQDAMRKDMPHVSCEEVMSIYDARVKELEPKKAETKPAANTKQEKAAEPKKADKETKNEAKETKKVGAPKIRKVGDRHPKQPWIWTEYQPGKFDWRIAPELKKKPGKKSDGAATTANQSDEKKGSSKANKASKKQPKNKPETKVTLEELLAKPVPQGLSKPQQNVVKLLKKGFRLRKDGNTYWLTDKDGNNERTEKAILEALQRKYKITDTPKDIWLSEK